MNVISMKEYRDRKALSVEAAGWCWFGMVVMIVIGWLWSLWA